MTSTQREIEVSYDVSNEFFKLWLDDNMHYTSASYLTGDETFEEAQIQKSKILADYAEVTEDSLVLDIGCGWGSNLEYLSKHRGVKEAHGITLSTAQCEWVHAKKMDGVKAIVCDYKDYVPERPYDALVSIEMIDHLCSPEQSRKGMAIEIYREYFRKVHDLLADDGVALIHSVGRSDGPGAMNAWVDKYIFPGAYAPALSEVLPIIERSGLIVTDIEILRLHYAETLREWRRRFMAARSDVLELYDERFIRMWEFYLASCEVSFRRWGFMVWQIQVSRRIDAVPITRDYIQNWERKHAAGGAIAA